MTTELPSKYDPSAVEAQAYKVWLDEKCFHADPAAAGESFCIVIPPPNVTGALHLGHAINNTLQDILTRQHRMAGFNTLWIPGIDHAGIATQAVVEKQLKEQENKTRHDVGREGLVERIWTWKQQYGDRILSQLQRLGCSCDWDRTRFTLDEMCAKAVRETFFKLFKDGLIYRGKRLVNWDTHLLTTISDDELYDEPVKTSLWSIKYPIDGSDDFVIVATTRPETMLADTAVAYHSSNPKAASFKGKQVRLPLTNRLIPLIEDDILVDPEFGTGYVKVTPAHDPNDYAVYTRHQGQPTEIAILNMMTPDGKVNDADPSWAAYTGLTFPAARKKIIEDLAAGGFHNPETDVKPHDANVKFSDRSKTAIQPYLSDQWFVKMAPLAEPALEVVREGLIKFHPERHAQQYLSWLGEKRDWPVSRQLWWGHRIPVWTKEVWLTPENYSSQLDAAIPSGVLRSPNALINWFKIIRADNGEELGVDPWAIKKTGIPDGRFFIYACTTGNEWAKKLEAFGFVQDPDVLDTWFSSALWPHSTLGWPEKTPELAKYYPTSVLLTGRDIITLWVARMVMMGMYNMGTEGRREGKGERERGREGEREGQREGFSGGTGGPLVPPSADQQDHGRAARATNLSAPSPLGTGAREQKARALGIPFFDVAINPTILDGKGERMSKTKGNGVDPVDIIFSHGADALRFTLTNMATETQDARMPVQVVCPHCGERLPNPDSKEPQMVCAKCKKKLTRPVSNATGSDDAPLARMTSDRFDLGRNFCNKLWNACRFALANLENVRGGETQPPTSASAGNPPSITGVSPVLDQKHGRDARDTNAVGSALADAKSLLSQDAPDVEIPPAGPDELPEEFKSASLGRSSDEDLMLKTQQGDKTAFSLLYERYSGAVLAYLYRALGKMEEVETIGQEVFLRAFRFSGTYQHPNEFSTWLFTITRNLAVNQSRRRMRSPIRHITELNLEGIDLTGDPHQVAARVTDDPQKQEEIARVLKALEMLPADQKEVIMLGVFQDQSYQEMEQTTGAKSEILRSRMFHGLKALANAVAGARETAESKADAESLAQQSASAKADPTMTSADRWIISRFYRAVAECDEALKAYRFDTYAKSCYDFFWRDFCDWYVEAIKPAMKDPARAGQTANVLAAVLDGALRLMHPMIPFITETIWWRLNEIRPVRGLSGLLECPPSKRLVLARWPTVARASSPCDKDFQTEKPLDSGMGWKPMPLEENTFPKLQEIISSIRTIRNDYQVNPRQPVAVSIKAPADFAAQIETNRELIELLATCTLKTVAADLVPPPNAVTASAAGCDIFVAGLIDPNAEKLRLAKEIETKQKQAQSMKARLGNEAYIAKAPPHLVQQSRDQLAALEAEVAKMEEALKKLG